MVSKKNPYESALQAFTIEVKFPSNPWLSLSFFKQPRPGQLRTISITEFRFVEAKYRLTRTKIQLMTGNFEKLSRNFATKFRFMPHIFVSVHHLVSEISQGLEQQMRRNFAKISSETKVRNLFVEIREIRSHFFFAQYCILLTLLPSGDFAFEAGFNKVDCRKCIFILLLLGNE